MHRTRIEIFDEANRKRPAPTEPTDGLDQAKRQRVTTEAPLKAHSVHPLPAGEVSWRQLYTLNPQGSSTGNFDVQMFKDPEQLLRIVVPVLQSVDAQKLDHAINVRDICFHLHHAQTLSWFTLAGRVLTERQVTWGLGANITVGHG
jgi:symplekin